MVRLDHGVIAVSDCVWDGAIGGAMEHVRACGVEIEEGPVDRPGVRGHGTSAYFRDPDGSLLELISNE